MIYGAKIVEPRMDPRGTPTLVGYSCQDFPSRITLTCLLLRKGRI